MRFTVTLDRFYVNIGFTQLRVYVCKCYLNKIIYGMSYGVDRM
jgi:hypothetical protein